MTTIQLYLELEYDWCNDKKMSLYTECLDACAAKNTGGQTGWTLAVIPTIMHNQKVVDLITESYPDDTDEEKFLWFWTGLRFETFQINTYFERI